MNQPLLSPRPSLPEDAPWLDALLGRPGGLGALAPAEAPRAARVVAALPLEALVARAAGQPPEGQEALYALWLGWNGAAPEAVGVWYNLGVARALRGAPDRAAEAFSAALALRPGFAEAALNLGLALENGGRPEEALAAWRAALPTRENRRALHLHLGRLMEERGQLGAALEELHACLAIEPDQPDVIQHYVHLRQRTARWPVAAAEGLALGEETLARNCGPLAALALRDDPGFQTEVTRAWIARKVAPGAERLAPEAGYPGHDRIRIGYLSTDFRAHAMSFLIAEVIERHDRARFEVHGYCVGAPDDGSAIRARVAGAFDRFARLADLSDEAAARAIRADEIDVLVDLNGLTRGARLGILRWKPAPVQCSYLGYIGPVPLPELDWLIADAATIPPEMDALYSPRPLRLEGCFQANDGRPFDPPAVSRAEEGLPEEAFVFCGFSHLYKITPEVFAAWTEIVARVPGSVLWLAEDNPEGQVALGARWQAAGLAPERLIFAPRVEPARYRARLALGDLYLDTSPYNAGTVASDALRMGLPVLTIRGRAFAARMAASLNEAVGRGDCVAADLADYVERAVALARDPARHGAPRAALAESWARTLGDCADFTRRLEAALARVARRG